MATILQFNKNIRSKASKILNSGVGITRKAALAAVKSMAAATPVDKGVARSNYRVSIGNRTFSVIPAFHPGKKLGIDETANLRAVISAARQKLATLRPGQAVFITNAVPYLPELEVGRDIVFNAVTEARISIQSTRSLFREDGIREELF